MRNILIVIALVLCGVINSTAKDDKGERKAKAAIDKEELRFRKDVEKNPGDATIYWKHANNLAAFPTEFKRAGDIYKKALELDSVNVDIYKDYGKYLLERLGSLEQARIILARGLQLASNDAELAQTMAAVDAAISRRDAEIKLRDVGTTKVNELNPGTSYASITNFDSLRMLLTDVSGDKNYYKLLNRFLADDKTLSPGDMYLLIVGYARLSDYNPFNYNDISTMKQLSAYSVDSAIRMGIEIMNTNPLNPSLNRELMYYYRKKNDFGTAEKYLNRVRQFYNGVLYSGNGTCDRPYISLWSKEAPNFISYLGKKPADNHSMGTCAGQMAEIIDMIDPASGKTEQICFNLKLVYTQTTGK